jgi:8-oxo-dGTP pyrophosphatase MutT (NUDIX family)
MGVEKSGTIRCRTIDCEYVDVPSRDVTFRVGAYGFIGRGTKLLLIRFPHLGQRTLPGGGVKPTETLEQAVVRECREEAGADVEVRGLVHTAQEFFLHPHTGRPHNCLSHFFECLLLDEPLIGSKCDKPDFPDAFAEWVDVSRPKGLALHPFIMKPVDLWLSLRRKADLPRGSVVPGPRRPIYYR